MKVLKHTITLFALLGVFSTATYAQTSDVNVSATVQAALSVITDADLTFGVITVNTQAVQPANGSSSLTAANNANATTGQVTIEGSAGLDVDISYNTGVQLSDGTNTVNFTPDIITQAGTTIAQTGTAVTLSGSAGLGQVVLDIGGTLDAITTPGTYTTASGTPITVTVAYN